MEIPLDEVLFGDAITSTPSTGAAVDADAAPTFAVYEEATDTDIGVGGNMTKRTSLTGNYRWTFTASAANGFEVGKWYSVIGSAVVGGVTGKAVLRNFRIVLAEAVVGSPKVDVETIKTRAVSAAGAVVVGGFVGQDTAAIVVNGSGHVSTVTTVTNQLAAATIAAAVEAAILNEGDATALLAAIAAKVEEFLINEGDASATLAAIAAAVRTNLAAELARIDVGIGTRLATAGYTAPPSAAAVSSQVGTDLSAAHGAGSWATATGFAIAGDAMTLTAGERNSIAMAHLDLAAGVETGLTIRQAMRLVAAAAAGKLSGAATTTIVIRNAVADSKDRITATVDASGNRSAITLDLT